MSDQDFPRSLAFQFLDELKKKFIGSQFVWIVRGRAAVLFSIGHNGNRGVASSVASCYGTGGSGGGGMR
jgi:hypothetical protein